MVHVSDKVRVVVIRITFLQSAYPHKVFSYKATENYMELKGKAVWSKDQNGGHVYVIAWLDDLARLKP